MNTYTFSDAVDTLIDYLGGAISDVAVRDCKRAVLDAYRELANAHNWSYLYSLGRINTSAIFTTGLLTYQGSGGSYPRQVTLASGVWPVWASFGYVRIATVNYKIDQRISDTVATFTDVECPDADITTPTGFNLYQDTYLLPEDFIAQDQALYEQNFGGMNYVHPREWVYENRYRFAQGIPQSYTIQGNRQIPGRLFLSLFPLPTEQRSIDYLYKRRPRPLTRYRVSAGTVALTSGSVAVTGTATAFDASLVGSVLRVSSAANQLPTAYVGANPAIFESIIQAVTDATHLTTVDSPSTTMVNGSYLISDPIDIEPGAMLSAFKRGCEMQISMNRTLKDKPSAKLQYQRALIEAKEADSRSFASRAEGRQGKFLQRARDMPGWPNVPDA